MAALNVTSNVSRDNVQRLFRDSGYMQYDSRGRMSDVGHWDCWGSHGELEVPV